MGAIAQLPELMQPSMDVADNRTSLLRQQLVILPADKQHKKQTDRREKAKVLAHSTI